MNIIETNKNSIVWDTTSAVGELQKIKPEDRIKVIDSIEMLADFLKKAEIRTISTSDLEEISANLKDKNVSVRINAVWNASSALREINKMDDEDATHVINNIDTFTSFLKDANIKKITTSELKFMLSELKIADVKLSQASFDH